MPTVNHPRIPRVTVEVPDSDVKRWEASGWVNLASTPEPERVDDEPPAYEREGGYVEGASVPDVDHGAPEPLVRPKRSRKK